MTGTMTTTAATHQHTAASVAGRGVAALLGLGVATLQLADGAERDGVVMTVLVASFCYVAAAATGRPWMAWGAVPVVLVVLLVAGATPLPSWAALAVTLAVTAAGGAVLAPDRLGAVGRQTAAAAGFGGLAVLALALPSTAGAVLAGTALAAHAGWDLLHLRRRTVVHPTLAWFCLLLDVPLGVAAAAVAVA